jgi:2-oxoglutarate ferredoxin oxidoreductase subunit gamma
MVSQIVSAGFGGQGILFLGDLLTRAGLMEGKHVTYFPTYGVAMRGGTANCVVTISDDEIGSPLLDHPHVAIVLNQPSFDLFQPMVRKGGLIVANSSIIDPATANRNGDVRLVWAPATEASRAAVGSDRSANMVILGAFLAAAPVVKLETIEAIFDKEKDERKRAMSQKNLSAIRAGMEFAKE